MANVGRPLKYTSVEDMQVLIDAYFKDCDENKRPYTVSGLAFALECSRSTLMDYQGKDKYSNTILRAKDKCELFSAELLLKKEGSTKGVEFNLSNNHRWADKQVIEQVNVNIAPALLTDIEIDAEIAILKAKLLD